MGCFTFSVHKKSTLWREKTNFVLFAMKSLSKALSWSNLDAAIFIVAVVFSNGSRKVTTAQYADLTWTCTKLITKYVIKLCWMFENHRIYSMPCKWCFVTLVKTIQLLTIIFWLNSKKSNSVFLKHFYCIYNTITHMFSKLVLYLQ